MMDGGYPGFVAHGEEHHPDHFLNGNPEAKNGRYQFAPKAYWCPLDEKWYSDRRHLARAIKADGWTNEQYFVAHGEAHMPDEWAMMMCDEKYGDAAGKPTCLQCGTDTPFNESKWTYPKFCGFSCSTKWHAENTDRVERAMATNRARAAADPTHRLLPNQIAYWTNKGLTESEAMERVRERQQTNLLERFMARYGEVEGKRRHAERQYQWLSSMKTSGMFKGVSSISRSLFEAVEDHVPDLKHGNNEVVVKLANRSIKVDGVLRAKKRVIEFYGDYWHGNPKIYGPTARIAKGVSAARKWEIDRKRTTALLAAGYSVMIVWESDYRANPVAIIERCVRYLTE